MEESGQVQLPPVPSRLSLSGRVRTSRLTLPSDFKGPDKQGGRLRESPPERVIRDVSFLSLFFCGHNTPPPPPARPTNELVFFSPLADDMDNIGVRSRVAAEQARLGDQKWLFLLLRAGQFPRVHAPLVRWEKVAVANQTIRRLLRAERLEGVVISVYRPASQRVRASTLPAAARGKASRARGKVGEKYGILSPPALPCPALLPSTIPRHLISRRHSTPRRRRQIPRSPPANQFRLYDRSPGRWRLSWNSTNEPVARIISSLANDAHFLTE